MKNKRKLCQKKIWKLSEKRESNPLKKKKKNHTQIETMSEFAIEMGLCRFEVLRSTIKPMISCHIRVNDSPIWTIEI